MAGFKIGDRVICMWPSKPHRGAVGTIISQTSADEFCVQTDVEFAAGSILFWMTSKYLEFATPISPFQQSLRTYISRELG